MSDCSNSVTKYFIVQPEAVSSGQTISGDLIVEGNVRVCGSGTTLSVNSITGCTSGVTINGNIFLNNGDINATTVITVPLINATTFSGGTLYGDGSNLTGISTVDSYMTGGTYSGGFLTFSGGSNFSEVTIDVSALIDDTNSYLTGATLNSITDDLTLSLNNQSDVVVNLSPIKFTGGTGSCITDLYVSTIHGCSPITLVDDTIFSGNTTFGGSVTMVPLPSSDSGLVQILGRDSSSGLIKYRDVNTIIGASTDSYVTGVTINSNNLELGRNQGLSTLSVDLSSYLDNTDNFITGGTLVGDTLVLDRTNALSAVTVDLSSFLDDTNYYVTGGTVSGTDLILSRNGGLSNVTIDTSSYFDNTDNYVTGATMNSNTLELSRSGGLSNVTVDLSQFLDDTNDGVVSGATMNGNTLELSRTEGLSNVTVDLSQFLDDTNFYVTGSTLNGNTLELSRNGGLSTLTTDLSQFLDNTDSFISGMTFNSTTFDLTIGRNDGIDFTENLGSLASDIYVMSGDYNPSTGIVTYTTNSGNTFQVSGFTTGMTDSYTTNVYLNGNEIRFDNNIQGTNLYNVDLTPLLSGKTNTTDFYSYTSTTQTTLDTKIDGGINVGGGHEVFSGFTGTDMYFRTLSGGSNTTLTTVGNVVKIDVSLAAGDNSYVTGSTLNGNTLELGRNGGLSTLTTDLSQFLDNTDNFITGGTLVGNILVLDRTNALSAVTVDFSQFLDDTNSYVTGGTVSGTDLILGRNGGLSNVTIDTSSYFDNTDRFVTGATMNVNTLELSRSGGLVDVTVDLSQFLDDTNDGVVSGVTLNGNSLELGRTEGLSTLSVDLSQFLDNTDNYVTGGTYTNSTLLFSGTSTNQAFSIDVSALLDDTNDGVVSGATMNGNTLELGRTQGLSDVTVDLSQFLDDTNFYVTGQTLNGTVLETSRNGGLSTLTTELSGLTSGDGIGASVSLPWKFSTTTTESDPSSKFFRFNNIDASGTTEIYVNDFTNNGVDASTILNSLDVGDRLYIQQNDDATKAYLFRISADTIDNTGWFTLPVEFEQGDGGNTPTNNKECGWVMFSLGSENNTISNIGVGQGVYKQKTGVDFELYSISGGTNTSVTLNSDTIVINTVDTNTDNYVTGATMNVNTLELSRSGGLADVTVDLSQFIDDTNDGVVSGATMNGNTLELGRTEGLGLVTVDLSQFLDNTDNYVSGGTMVGNTLVLDRTNALSAVTVDMSQFLDNTNFYVTGSTLNGNTLELGRNGGLSTLTTDLSTLNPSSTLDRKYFIPASMASTMGSSSLTYHGTTGVALLAFGGNNPDDEMGSFPMVVPQDYVSGGTFELIYTSQTTANDMVWSFGITNASNGVDFSTFTESGPHLDLVVSGQTFLNRGTSQVTTPTGTTFNTYDAVTVRVNRDASDSRDTANNVTGYIYGLIFNYKANN